MRPFPKRLPIAARVGGGIIVLTVLFAAFMAIYPPRQQRILAQQALREKTHVVAQISSYEMASALDFDDTEVINDALKAMALDQDFIFSAVYDDSGKRIAQFSTNTEQGRKATAWLDSLDVRTASGTVVNEAPWGLDVRRGISTPGGKKATLVAGFSLQRIEQESAVAQRTMLTVAALMVLLGAGFAYLLGRNIGTRVARVVDTARSIARGNLTQVPIQDSGRDEIGDIVSSFNEMNDNLNKLAKQVSEVAAGNLAETVEVRGDLAEAFNRMVINQRQLVSQISETATQLNSAAGEFFASAKQQERGATSQSSAVEEIRRTLQTLLASAREIGTTADDVLTNAETTQRNSQKVSEHIAELSAQNRRISEILEIIKDIANKSDLLALNAGLEGTKAGEAGRGFSLVASQMQRLAENVMGAVRDIKELTATITESTESTVLATEESTKLAGHTTRSARQIGLIIQQQQTGTEQATRAMEDVGEVAGQTAAGSKQIVQSATDLMNLSERLQALVGRFRIGDRMRKELNAAE